MNNPYQQLGMPAPEVTVREQGDGALILSSPIPLGEYPKRLGDWLYHWAAKAPDRTFLAERNQAGNWDSIDYARTLSLVESIAQSLLDRGLNTETPLAIVSGNSIRHALLTLAAMHIGVPVVPVSPAYSLLSTDYEKLRSIIGLTRPGMIYVEDTDSFRNALDAVNANAVEIVSYRGAGATPFDSLTEAAASRSVKAGFENTGPDTVAKILFTSGSTGTPKGVINTQRMLCSNQKSLQLIWPFLPQQPPVAVDWLPWHHTFGGNHNFNMMLSNGGSLYIDAGKPRPGALDATIDNLKSVPPTLYFNVPLGMELIIERLEQDDDLRRRFFTHLKLIVCAGAALPHNLWQRLQALALRERHEEIPVVSSWGSTETAPLCTSTHFPVTGSNPLGLPVPGVEVKLAPRDGRYELRVRGPNTMPGYFKRLSATAEAFDEQGFYCMGDAGKLADPLSAQKGLVFDGRLAEEFKLSSGTWVQSGLLRLAVISACNPLVQDAVVTAPNQTEIGLLLIPNREECCRLAAASCAGDLSPEAVMACAEVRRHIAAGLAALNADKSSSQRIERAIFLTDPLSIDRGEITDKGYLNQRAILSTKADLVAELYRGSDRVIDSA